MVLADTIDSCSQLNLPIRNLRMIIFGDLLKEHLGSIKVKYDVNSDDYYSLLRRVAVEHKLPEDTPLEKLIELTSADYEKWANFIYNGTRITPKNYSYVCPNVVVQTKLMLNSIDKIIEWIYNTIKTAESVDDRMGSATYKSSMMTFLDEDDISYDPSRYVNAKEQSKDPFSKDNLRLKIKQLRSFKASIIQIFHKSYGKNSPFASLNLSDQIAI